MFALPVEFAGTLDTPLPELFDNFLHQHLGRRGPCGQADAMPALQPLATQVCSAIDQISRHPRTDAELDEAVRIGELVTEPTTSKRSASRRSSLTASWRFCVA